MSGLLSFAQGGASQSITNAENALNPLGTATQQMYGGAIGSLMSSPTGYQNTALAGAQGAFANQTLQAGGVSPSLTALMKPYENMMQGQSFSTYLGNLADLSGATSAGQQATAMQQMTQANQQASIMGGMGTALGSLASRYNPSTSTLSPSEATNTLAMGGYTPAGWNSVQPALSVATPDAAYMNYLQGLGQ